MQLIHDPTEFAAHSDFIIMTIGNFDGVHLGHQAIFQYMSQQKKQNNGHSLLITFPTHPAQILHERTTPALCSFSQKLELFQQAGIDTVLSIPFTKEFSQQSGEQFLHSLRQKIAFQSLVLGYDGAMGKDRKADRPTLQKIAASEHFNLHFVDQYFVEDTPVSSTLIRKLIQSGDLGQAEKLLGRPYTFRSNVIKGQGKGKTLGFPTVNLDISTYALPPYGIYPAILTCDNKIYKGVANLGVAPTVRQDTSPLLEIYLFDDVNLYDREVDVVLGPYIRPERKFESLEALKAQIAKDVVEAKRMLEGV